MNTHTDYSSDNRRVVEMAYKYNDYLISFAQRYARCKEDAEDIVQDTYLTLMNRATISPEEIRKDNFCGYLRKQVYWRSLEYYKNRLPHSDSEDTESIGMTHSERKEDTDFAHAVRDEAIKAVPRPYRPAILMWLSGMNFLQIANRTEQGGSYENARARIAKYMPLFTARARRLAWAGV